MYWIYLKHEPAECNKRKEGRTGEGLWWLTPEEREVFKLRKLCTPPQIPSVF